MKNFKKLFALAIAVILLAGCGMKESVSFKVTQDKKVSMGAKIMMDADMIDAFLSFNSGSYDSEDLTTTNTYTDAERKAYLQKNICPTEESDKATCKVFTEGKYLGVEITTVPIDIDEFVATTEDEEMDMGGVMDGGFDVNSKLFTKSGDVYSTNLKMTNDSYTGSMGDYSSQIDEFNIVFSMTLPNAPISHNADSVSSDGLTYTWNYDLKNLSNAKDIQLSFKFDPNSKPTTVDPDPDNKKPNTNTNTNNGNTTTGDDKKSEGMSTTTLVLIIVCSVLGLALISILIIVFARKSTKNPIPNSPQSPAAAAFKNPELKSHDAPADAPTETEVEEDSVNVSEMTNAEEPAETEPEEKPEDTNKSE